PNETVTLNFTLHNVGIADASNVVATLQGTGGVTAPSGAQTYGLLSTSGAAVTKAFSFTATGACGDILVATLQLQNGSTNLGSVSFNVQLGTVGGFGTNLTQNFDGVTKPTLPA